MRHRKRPILDLAFISLVLNVALLLLTLNHYQKGTQGNFFSKGSFHQESYDFGESKNIE